MISAYTMTVYVQPDMRACASAILELLLCWPPMLPAPTTVTPVNLPQDGAVAACASPVAYRPSRQLASKSPLGSQACPGASVH
jgi:hypothetical protein